MMKKKQSIIALVLAAIVTLLLGWTMIKGWGPTGTGSMKNIDLGLDLSGGVSITYQAVKDNPTDEEMSDTRYKLEQRAQQYSEEAQVYLQGDNRITIEIPGATDATTILEEMGKPGSLYFIKQTNDDGTENYTYDSSTGEYVLNGKTIEELEEDGSVVLTGKDVASAEAMHQQNSTTKATESVVQLKMTDEGKQKFADATQEAYSAGKSIGIYYDEKFVSVPSVNAVISDGTAVISGGNMDWDEATSLASTLRIGSLSLELEEINSSVVGAQLGSAAVSTSVKAGAIGIILIIIFLAVVYRLPGIAAGWALLIYVELNLISLNAFDLTLTLPGIAGVILSIGMAVDASYHLRPYRGGDRCRKGGSCSNPRRIQEGSFRHPGRKRNDSDCSSRSVCTRKRKCPRIRHDTCSWYCSFHVQRHGCFQTAGQQPVRYGTEGCEILRNQERAQGISICGKEKDLLHDLLHSAACRSGQHDFHASDKGKRTEFRP